MKGRSKPCLHSLTGGALKCDRCTPFDPIDVIGYQPLYRESDARPCMTIVHDYSREQIDALKLHQFVVVGRNEGSTDAVWIMPPPTTTQKYQSRLPERMRPADLTETLLRVWAIPELCEWYAKTHKGSDNAVSLPPPPPPNPEPGVRVKGNGKPFTPMMNAAAARAGFAIADDEPESGVDASLKRAMERAKKAEANGKHE